MERRLQDPCKKEDGGGEEEEAGGGAEEAGRGTLQGLEERHADLALKFQQQQQ